MKKEYKEGKRNGDMSETTGKKPAVKKKVRRKGKRRVSLRRRILTILAILMPAALIAGVILYFLGPVTARYFPSFFTATTNFL